MMKLKSLGLKLYGHTGHSTGARVVQGGRAFENRMLYIQQSKNTVNGRAAPVPKLAEVLHAK